MTDAQDIIEAGKTALGIELGSTRIKACLIGPNCETLGSGASDWENRFEARTWTYSLEDVWSGIQQTVAQLIDDVEANFGVRPATFGAMGVSAMMHGYLAFDSDEQLLVPFRTWRNTTTAPASAKLSRLFEHNIPLRWSVAHHYQAMLDSEDHVPQVDYLTTLAGYVHWRLTGRRVLGVGDASGMFPVDLNASFNSKMLAKFNSITEELPSHIRPRQPLEDILPEILIAGRYAGTLTKEGAALLDPSGTLQPGIPLCPPEGDAGTGMVATNAVAPRIGNVSAGTSIFAMVVLESPLSKVHPEIDVVTTPAGEPVAMVHCNNGASELGAWAKLLREFSAALGHQAEAGQVYDALLNAALSGDTDGGGLLAYNYLAGEPITDLEEGRPMVIRAPGSRMNLANFSRAQLYSIFGTLSLGMKILAEEGVNVDTIFAHGGLFKTANVAQRLLAAAVDTPVAVGDTAAEGGSWGMAVLAAYSLDRSSHSLVNYLDEYVFNLRTFSVVEPDPADVSGYKSWLEQYSAGLTIQSAAIKALQ
ncbi:xylulokinase [Nesterenkonia natronophila]|uniref:ATPase n=1 Tax=Nesterenkonia natronophila TaxID=2174932 RepID=A0A3A4F669_9MICC|nr:FGGY-family carbohydrate kinase [Nesterenkonia natronophila]RJN33201.1 ATPase [Nesterenkonia natronophila]